MHTAAEAVLHKKTIEHKEKRYTMETAIERVRAFVKDRDWDQLDVYKRQLLFIMSLYPYEPLKVKY